MRFGDEPRIRREGFFIPVIKKIRVKWNTICRLCALVINPMTLFQERVSKKDKPFRFGRMGKSFFF